MAIVVMLPATAAAQDEPEYRMEVGAGVGLASYQGDFNGQLFSNMQPMGGIVAKYKMNPRMAWAAALRYGQLKGSAKNEDTWYPDQVPADYDFTAKVVDFSLRYEYNFWAFGTGREYLGARRLVPFITLGAGVAVARNNGSHTAFQVPIGVGAKYKLQDRLNLSLDWTIHITGSDMIDGVKDPYGIKSSGLFKNTDCYSMLQVTLTYDVWARCKTCHNDRD